MQPPPAPVEDVPNRPPTEAEQRWVLGALLGVPADDAAVVDIVREVTWTVEQRRWRDLPLGFQAGELIEFNGTKYRRERARTIK